MSNPKFNIRESENYRPPTDGKFRKALTQVRPDGVLVEVCRVEDRSKESLDVEIEHGFVLDFSAAQYLFVRLGQYLQMMATVHRAGIQQ